MTTLEETTALFSGLVLLGKSRTAVIYLRIKRVEENVYWQKRPKVMSENGKDDRDHFFTRSVDTDSFFRWVTRCDFLSEFAISYYFLSQIVKRLPTQLSRSIVLWLIGHCMHVQFCISKPIRD